jgi:hypothetical protein
MDEVGETAIKVTEGADPPEAVAVAEAVVVAEAEDHQTTQDLGAQEPSCPYRLP